MLPASGKSLALFIWLSVSSCLLGDPATQPAKSQAALERETRAERAFGHWCERFLNVASRPPPNTKHELHPRDGKDYPVDIVRATYKIGDRNVTVTQAKTVFCIKIEGVTVRAGEEGIKDIEQVARETFIGADKLQMRWFDEEASPKQGGAKPNQAELPAFLRFLAFNVDGTTVRFYNVKVIDAPQKMVLGLGVSLNRNWFTLTPEAEDAHYKDDGVTEVLATVFR